MTYLNRADPTSRISIKNVSIVKINYDFSMSRFPAGVCVCVCVCVCVAASWYKLFIWELKIVICYTNIVNKVDDWNEF
jgi:hypothetical protein